MPQYLYRHPDTGEEKEVFQTMEEEHVYSEDGVEFDRVFTVPQASIDTKVDPFSAKKFVEKTGNQKGTVGDLWDRARDLSEAREDKLGHKDTVEEKYQKAYAKKRHGKKPRNHRISKDSVIEV